MRIASFVLLAAVAFPASAVNLLTNPSFAGNLNGWNVYPGTVFDPTADATGAPGSGSARLTFIAAGASPPFVPAVDQCVAAAPGTYLFGAKISISAQPTQNAKAIPIVRWYSGPDCTTGFIGGVGIVTPATTSFLPDYFSVDAPPGTTHALVSGEFSPTAAGPFIASFDDFVLDDGVPVPALGPMVLVTMVLGFAAVALVTLRR